MFYLFYAIGVMMTIGVTIAAIKESRANGSKTIKFHELAAFGMFAVLLFSVDAAFDCGFFVALGVLLAMAIPPAAFDSYFVRSDFRDTMSKISINTNMYRLKIVGGKFFGVMTGSVVEIRNYGMLNVGHVSDIDGSDISQDFHVSINCKTGEVESMWGLTISDAISQMAKSVGDSSHSGLISFSKAEELDELLKNIEWMFLRGGQEEVLRETRLMSEEP